MADYILVILSPAAVASNWVQAEWQSMFWDEIGQQKTKVIPIFYKECDVPHFLKTKKYVDFRKDFDYGFYELCRAIQK